MAATKPDDVLIPFRPNDEHGYAFEIEDGEVLVYGCDCAQAIEDVDVAEKIAAALTNWAAWKRHEIESASA